jgi:hypothetical protein
VHVGARRGRRSPPHVEARIARQGTESLVIFSRTGRPLAEFTQGLPHGTRLPDDWRYAVKGRIVLHNHPVHTPPSPQDLRSAAVRNVLEERIVTPRAVYRLLRPREGWPLADELAAAVDRQLPLGAMGPRLVRDFHRRQFKLTRAVAWDFDVPFLVERRRYYRLIETRRRGGMRRQR